MSEVSVQQATLTKSDASVIQEVEADVSTPALQLPLPLMRSEALHSASLRYGLPAGHEAGCHVPHKLHPGHHVLKGNA